MPVRATLRAALRAGDKSANPLVRLGVRSTRATYRLVMLCSTAEHRSTLRTQMLRPRALHQTTVLTWMGRYPGIFAACRDHLGDRPELRILSFGCSTGEEVLTLREYFPSATIVGAEINARSLALCRRREVDERIAFIPSDPETIRGHGPYDAILCMAVLQRTPHLLEARGTTDLRRIYPFEKFDRQVGELDRELKRDGLLVIHHSQYRFADASVAPRYVPLDPEGQEVDFTLTFDRAGQRMDRAPTVGSVWVKVAG
ncbi:MAG: methyltransferase domain-containing protein [Actinomycetota bacterium]|nr:methyltransferase domain-containing protein [Actinomycetota bacterium]